MYLTDREYKNNDFYKEVILDDTSDTPFEPFEIDPLMARIDAAITASFAPAFVEQNKKQVYRRLKKFLGRKPITSIDSTFATFQKRERQLHNFWGSFIVQILISVSPGIIMVLVAVAAFLQGELGNVIKNLNFNLLTTVLIFIIICICLFALYAIYRLCRYIYFKITDYVESYITKQNDQ